MIAGLDTILKAELIADVRRAFVRIEALEHDHDRIMALTTSIDARVREVEAGLREAKSEIKFEALRETQAIVNSVQGGLHRQIADLAIQVDRLASRDPGQPGRLVDQRDG